MTNSVGVFLLLMNLWFSLTSLSLSVNVVAEKNRLWCMRCVFFSTFIQIFGFTVEKGRRNSKKIKSFINKTEYQQQCLTTKFCSPSAQFRYKKRRWKLVLFAAAKLLIFRVNNKNSEKNMKEYTRSNKYSWFQSCFKRCSIDWNHSSPKKHTLSPKQWTKCFIVRVLSLLA